MNGPVAGPEGHVAQPPALAPAKRPPEPLERMPLHGHQPALVVGIHLGVAHARGTHGLVGVQRGADRKSTRLNSSHLVISYAVFCLKKKNEYMLSTSTLH